MPSHQPQTPAPQSPAQTLPQRIANWGTNLLVTGVLAIASLAFGRQVISWWGVESNSLAIRDSVTDVVGVPSNLNDAEIQLLEVGDFPYLVARQEIAGTIKEVLTELRGNGRNALTESREIDGEPGAAELRMLRGLAALQPVEQLSGRGAIYQVERPLPMTVAIKEPSQQVAGGARRVVSWGLAFPTNSPTADADVTWTLFTFSVGQAPASDRSTWQIPPAPMAQRTLSLRTADGGTLIGFRGAGDPRDWIQFYDDWFQQQAWQADDEWHGQTGTWRRRYVLPNAAAADLLVRVRSPGELHALAVVIPQTTFHSNSEKNP